MSAPESTAAESSEQKGEALRALGTSGRLSRDHPRYSALHQTIVSQAIVGEALAIDNYARMIPLASTLDERLQLVEAAANERRHILMLREVAKHVGVTVVTPTEDYYWNCVRAAFDDRVTAGDLTTLYLIQDVVLESFAVTLYATIASALEEFVTRRVKAILVDEEAHLVEGSARLRDAYEVDPEGTLTRMDFANERVGRALAEWIRPQECQPICGVCGKTGGGCAKPDMELLSIDMREVQGQFTARYGDCLRGAGLPPSAVTRWLARLPP